jgi:hypothetical protein
MKQLLSSLLTCSLCIHLLYGQQTDHMKFGRINQAAVDLTVYADDPEAEAVVLFDLGKSYFVDGGNGFDVMFERTTRIKILSSAGLGWANIQIPFYQESGIIEDITEIEAYTYNFENGKLDKIPLNPSSIYEEEINNFWRVKKFAFPQVKEGSIIEYKYTIKSPYAFNLRSWEFQWKIPVVYSEYEVRMIPFYEYRWILQGATQFDFHENYIDKSVSRRIGSAGPYMDNTYNDVVYKYGMKHVPAFKNEAFITTIKDYIIKINYQLSKINRLNGTHRDVITTWPNLVETLLKSSDFGKYVSRVQSQASKLIDVKAIAQKPEKEKFDYVIDFVKENYRWDRVNTKTTRKSPRQFINDREGNSAEINLFAIGLLNAVGIEAHPLLSSTRSHGKINFEYPFMHFFNYVLITANLDGKIVLSDATDALARNNRIPPRCINDKGLIVRKGDVTLISLETLDPSEIRTEISYRFDPEGRVRASIVTKAYEYEAYLMRQNFTDQVKTVQDQLAKKNYYPDADNITVYNQHEKNKPYLLEYEIDVSVEKLESKIYMLPFLNEAMRENLLKEPIRNHPVDLTFPKKHEFLATIEIPEGYQLDHLPQNERMSTQLFELIYITELKEDKVVLLFNYSFKKPVYPAAEYNQIRAFFERIANKSNEKLVFSPIGSVQE